jgi:hypothetical protein
MLTSIADTVRGGGIAASPMSRLHIPTCNLLEIVCYGDAERCAWGRRGRYNLAVIDPFRSLAAAIVWRAMQDAFCSNKRQPNMGLCVGRHSCESCRAEAEDWLLSDVGLQMVENAGLDAVAVAARIHMLRHEGLLIQARRRGIVWVRGQ